MNDKDAKAVIAGAVRACYASPDNQDFLIQKIVEYAKNDRDFYKKLFGQVIDIHGGKRAQIPLSQHEKEAIAGTYELWRPNYATAEETRIAMGDFFALGEKSIEAVITEINRMQ